MRGFHFVLVASVLAGTAMIECSNDNNNCTDAGGCVDSGIPTVSGGGCDSNKAASQGGCAVDDSDGFFVAPSGSDTAAGSKVAPFATIGKGIAAASAAPLKPNVYVCVGNYPENLVIQNAPAGVALHGGFECTSWVQSNGLVTVTPAWVPNSPNPQFVLRVNGAAALVEGLTLTAPNTTDLGASSIGALIAGSPGTTFRRATVTAGSASNGGDGVQAGQLTANASGNVNSDGTASPAKVCPCSTDSTTGGAGGGYVDGGFVPPANGAPVVNGVDAGRAGVVTNPPGGNGADGLIGKNGNSTTALGDLTANGWTPSPGSTGATGGTAQGGGGAYGDPGSNVSGGSGGCGGCGGQGGAGGGGGGGSIAIGVIGSTLRIQSSTIRAGKAGNGGNGGVGQLGQPGGIGGKNQAPGGGTGGSGGGGGGGGGGAGGVSIAIATASTTPDVDQQSTIVAGTAGAGGHDAVGVQNKAVDGIAAALHAF